jgi:hypothetical protein
MKHTVLRVVLSVILAATAGVAGAFAQGSAASSLSGTVTDSSGAVIPGASVVAKHNATGVAYNTVTNDAGAFSLPALSTGAYTVTVSLQGFKTVVLNDVILEAARPTSVRATIELGSLQETVTVEGASPIVQTQASAVSTTLNVESVQNLPITSRNVLDIVPFLPGVNTPGGNRDSTVYGLPQSAINITLDGVNVQDNTLKTTDGFFTIVQPRIDAIEEVTVTTAAQGADGAGQGAVQIQFVTKSGTNEYHGSGYYYYRNDALNSNTWFNKVKGEPKPELLQRQPGVRVGGPLSIPGLFDGRDRAFFFVNYEELRQPSTVSRSNRFILSTLAQQGIFRYRAAGGLRQVDLLALAAANGQTATFDPIISRLLGDIRNATGQTGVVEDLPDPNQQRYSQQVPTEAKNRYPTVRLDLNVTQNHRLSGVFNYHTFLSAPDTLNNREPRFPGFPSTGTQSSSRRQFSGALRSTLGQSIVNEFRVGYSGAPVFFFKELDTAMWAGPPVADQGGFYLNMENSLGITNASLGPTPSSRDANTVLIENTLNWLKGRHSIRLGGSFTQADIWLKNQNLVPELRFNVVTGDPASSMFTTANFPGAAATDLTRAQQLYNILTGRVSEVMGNARIDEETGQYTYLGASIQRARMRDFGFYAQDYWRMRPNLSLNFGLRYELQLPFYALNNSYSTATINDLCGVSGADGDTSCNLFQPGNTPGQRPLFINLPEGESVYETDWNNFAPSVGFNWNPTAQSGWLKHLFGEEGDTAISAGFAQTFNRNGLSDFTNVFQNNPGVQITVDRNQGLNNLGPLPLLFRDAARLAPPPFASSPEYPLSDAVTQDVNIFVSNLQVPWSQSWQIGIERAIGQTPMSIGARYIGTRSGNLWLERNYNEINVTENGFLQEFRLAQQNLQANIAAGRGANFRYFGPGTGTAPLPIYLAYFAGMAAGQAGNPANYSSSFFADNTFLNPLARFNPQPYVAANALDDTAARRTNAQRAGLPTNFLLANPDLLGGARLTSSDDKTHYNALVLEFKRRMSDGLQLQSSYVYGKTAASSYFSFRQPSQYRRDAFGEGEVTHGFKGTWLYQLPFGRDQRFGSGVNPVVNGVIGGWSLAGTWRLQSGRLIDFGNVRMVGFNENDLRDMYKLRIDSNNRVWMLPQEVIDNTVAAFSTSATSPTGYGPLGAPTGRYFAPANGPDCVEVDHDGDGLNNNGPTNTTLPGGPGNVSDEFGLCGTGSLVVTGPMFQSYDLSVMKQIRLGGNMNAEIRFEILNAFNSTNYIPVGLGSNGPNNQGNPNNSAWYEVTELTGTQTARTTQLVFRLNW